MKKNNNNSCHDAFKWGQDSRGGLNGHALLINRLQTCCHMKLHNMTVFPMITPDRFLLTDLRVILTCSVWAIMDTKLFPCKQTNDKICSLEDDNRYKRWKMQKMATTIKCYHDSFTDNTLPLFLHLIRIKAQCEKSASCPYQRGWRLASIQVLVSNNKSASSSLKQFIFFLEKDLF